jgi:hypothetical protein
MREGRKGVPPPGATQQPAYPLCSATQYNLHAGSHAGGVVVVAHNLYYIFIYIFISLYIFIYLFIYIFIYIYI